MSTEALAELRFDATLYDPGAVEEAVRSFEGLATVELEAVEGAVLVRLSDPHPVYGAGLAGELANHALHRTIARRGPDPESP